MATQHQSISKELASFIKKQKIYFIAIATEQGKVNMSPKGMDSLGC